MPLCLRMRRRKEDTARVRLIPFMFREEEPKGRWKGLTKTNNDSPPFDGEVPRSFSPCRPQQSASLAAEDPYERLVTWLGLPGLDGTLFPSSRTRSVGRRTLVWFCRWS